MCQSPRPRRMHTGPIAAAPTRPHIVVPPLHGGCVLAGAHVLASGEQPIHTGGRPCPAALPHALPSFSWSSRPSITSTSVVDKLASAIANSKLVAVVLVLAMFLASA